MEKRIIGVGGSPRSGGNSDLILQRVLNGAEEIGIEVKTLYLRNYTFSSCVGCEACRKDCICTRLLDGMQLIYPEIIKSQGIVLATPVHFYNVSAWMKAFIDRLYCFFEFTKDHPRQYQICLSGEGRRAVTCAVCEQMNEQDMGFTQEAMRLPLQALGYGIESEVNAYGYFAKGTVAKSEELMLRCEEAGRALAKSLQ